MKEAEVVRVYLSPDTSTLLSVADHCLRSRPYVIVIVAGKQPGRWSLANPLRAACHTWRRRTARRCFPVDRDGSGDVPGGWTDG